MIKRSLWILALTAIVRLFIWRQIKRRARRRQKRRSI